MILRGSGVILGPSETAAVRPNRARTGPEGCKRDLRPLSPVEDGITWFGRSRA